MIRHNILVNLGERDSRRQGFHHAITGFVPDLLIVATAALFKGLLLELANPGSHVDLYSAPVMHGNPEEM